MGVARANLLQPARRKVFDFSFVHPFTGVETLSRMLSITCTKPRGKSISVPMNKPALCVPCIAITYGRLEEEYLRLFSIL